MTRVPWVCYPNHFTCRPGADGESHLLRYSNSDYRADVRRLSGHAFFECQKCEPPTYIFAVFSTSPSPQVTCYEIGRESYKHWVADKSDETFTTQEMLYRLKDPEGQSLNPHWRPPR